MEVTEAMRVFSQECEGTTGSCSSLLTPSLAPVTSVLGLGGATSAWTVLRELSG